MPKKKIECPEACGELLSNKQALAAHRRYCPNRKRETSETPIEFGDFPSAGRSAGRSGNDGSLPTAQETLDGKDLQSNGIPAGSLPALSSLSSEDTKQEDKALSFASYEVRDPARGVNDAIKFLAANQDLLDDWQLKFFASVQYRASVRSLAKGEQEKLFEVVAVIRIQVNRIEREEKAYDAFMLKARHPIEVKNPDHDRKSCPICVADVEARKRHDAAFEAELAEMYERAKGLPNA